MSQQNNSTPAKSYPNRDKSSTKTTKTKTKTKKGNNINKAATGYGNPAATKEPVQTKSDLCKSVKTT